jgi:SH3-like domain-containing protein
MVRIIVFALLAALPMGAAAAPPETPHHHAKHAEHGHHADGPQPVHHAEAPKPAHHAAKPVPMVRPHVVPHPPASTPAPAPEPAAPAAPATPPEPAKGSNTGLPLPRFASLKTDEVNLRSGPGLRYPIEWVYKRRDLPVEIQREFEVWRLVADSEGVKGWVHQATLVGRRTFVVQGTAEQTMRDDAKPDASPVARLKPGVIGRIRACEAKADWCQVQVGEYRGWLPRTAFWGSYSGEAIQ